jgi:hypothetical protein
MISKLGNNKDKFGYYTVGEFKTYSKVEAIELSSITKKHVQWHFNDIEFSNYDWTKEPDPSLNYLYAIRAKQIREAYDHVVLFYSGGSDASNMLDAFVDNNIEFDEIATTDYLQSDPDPDSYFHAEQFKVSFPRIQELQDKGLRFKHRRIDLSEISLRVLNDPWFKTQRAYFGNSHWGTSHLSKSYIRECTSDYQDIIDSGKKLVFVWGCDKPRLFMQNNKFCLRFQDCTDTTVPIRTRICNREWEYDEYFYWAPECIDMVCKQAHVLMKFFKKHKIYLEHGFLNENKVQIPDLDLIFNNPNTYDNMSHRELINTIIYPGWNPMTFSSGKRYGTVYTARDHHFLAQSHLTSSINNCMTHLSQLDEYWINDPDNINQGLKGCLSPPYFLE